MSELKPCPFCGNEPTVTNEFDDEVLFYGCTKDIDCPLYDAPFVNLENWNTRPIEDELQKRIAELEAERRWIPVSERLPKENAPVLVLTVLGGMFVDFIHGKSVVTGNPDFYELDVEDVTHWMPLPKLPEVQE